MNIRITYSPEEVYDAKQIKQIIEAVEAWQDPVHVIDLIEQHEIKDNDSE